VTLASFSGRSGQRYLAIDASVAMSGSAQYSLQGFDAGRLRQLRCKGIAGTNMRTGVQPSIILAGPASHAAPMGIREPLPARGR
jgi:hypothetical protein